jgi:hypothetical protein
MGHFICTTFLRYGNLFLHITPFRYTEDRNKTLQFRRWRVLPRKRYKTCLKRQLLTDNALHAQLWLRISEHLTYRISPRGTVPVLDSLFSIPVMFRYYLLGRQPISTKSVDASQYIKTGLWALPVRTSDAKRICMKTPLQNGEKWDEKRTIFTVLLNIIWWLQRLWLGRNLITAAYNLEKTSSELASHGIYNLNGPTPSHKAIVE